MGRPTWFGFALVLIGVLILVAHLHVAPVLLTAGVIWPLLLVVVGVGGIGQLRRGRIPWISLFLIVFGVLLALKNTGYAVWLQPIGGWTMFWSVLIIFAGLALLFPGRWRRWASTKSDLSIGTADWNKQAWKHHKHKWKMKSADQHSYGPKWAGDLSVGNHPWVLKDSRIWNGLGDIRVNLATAHVENGTYTLDIGGWMGQVRVLVPSDLPITVHAELRMGDIDLFGEHHSGITPRLDHEDLGYQDAARRVRIDVELWMGQIQFVRV